MSTENATHIGEQVTYYKRGKDNKRKKTWGEVIAIQDCGDYKKILLHTGKTVYRAN